MKRLQGYVTVNTVKMECDSESGFKKYLKEYSDRAVLYPSPDDLIFKLDYYTLTEEDVIGECLAICQQELSQCPEDLLRLVSNATLQEIRKMDMQQWLCAPIAEEEFGEDESSSDTVKIGEDSGPPSLPTPKLLRMEKFMFDVLRHLHEICKSWSDNFPAQPKTHHQSKPPQVVAHGIRNTRRKMEDRHIAVTHLENYLPASCDEFNNMGSRKTTHYYAVFDGHGGVEAAIYSAAHLHVYLTQDLAFTLDTPTALKRAFSKTDQGFIVKSNHEKMRSGCTGLVVTLDDKQLNVAWCGDSQALLVRDGCYEEVMNPHKPEREDEKKRIEDLGGCVVWFGVWRVNGTLSVSRAIGDAMFKPYVTAEPDIATIDLQGNEDYMVLGCDGLWDTVSPHELVNHVYDFMQENSADDLPQSLISLARDNGSSDNITVMVIFLKDKISKPNLPDLKDARESIGSEEVCEVTEKDDEPVNVADKEETNKEEDKEEDEDMKREKQGAGDGDTDVLFKFKDRKDDDEDDGNGGAGAGNKGQSSPGDSSGSQPAGDNQGHRETGGSSSESNGSKSQGQQRSGGPPSEYLCRSKLSTIYEVITEEPGIQSQRISGFLNKLVGDIKFIDDETDEESIGSETVDSQTGDDSQGKCSASVTTNQHDDLNDIPMNQEEDCQTDSPLNVPTTVGLGSGDSVSSAMGLTLESVELSDSNPESKTVSDKPQDIGRSGSKSSISQEGMALMAQTANRCVSARRNKKHRNGHRRNNKDNCRPSREKLAASSQGVSPKRMTTRSNTSASSRKLSQQRKFSGTELVGMLTGLGSKNASPKPNRGRWTIAVEIDPNEIFALDNMENIRHGKKF